SSKSIKIESGELSMVPKNTIKVDDINLARKILALVDDLEDNDDVQNVYTNFDIPDEIIKQIEDEA
ncbi:MAG TPA: YebC/PmpR family DNA-binding transcriptional regulator, partial [Candidatus Omnitrophota bacterium]|nr:YebC/PmpR family DNA-binding transcriptional regulator [Candidatus Omnitrophota bacterium]